MLLAFAGVIAGVISTVTGMGGGVLLLAVLALWWGPLAALVASSIALVIGCAHRLALYRGHVAWRAALPILAGAIPGGVVGAALIGALPPALIYGCVVGMVGVAAARAGLGWTWQPSPGALVAPAAGVGVASAAGGGAGLLVGPMLIAIGVTGDAYVSTMALTGVTVNAARVAGYALSGAVGPAALIVGAELGLALIAGNWLGHAVRRRIAPRWLPRLELGAVGASALIAVLGAVRAAL